MSYVGYKSQPLDFMIYQNGNTGPQGRSIVSSTRYYALVPTTGTAPSAPLNKTTATAFTDTKGIKWSISPEAFKAQHTYYETTLTTYTAVDQNNKDFAWSTPVEQTIMDIDFINSLGITAKKIDVVDTTGNTVFMADGFAENPEVQIGGFNVTANTLTAGSGNGFVSLQTTEDKREYTPAKYIESNGCQYIDTGLKYVPTKDYSIKLQISYNSVEHDNQICGFSGNGGCGIGTQGNKWWENEQTYNPIPTEYSSQVKYDHDLLVEPNTIYDLEWSLSTTDDYEKKVKKATDTQYYITANNKLSLTTEAMKQLAQTSLLLLAADDSATTPPQVTYYCHAKLYSCQISENGNIVRNFIPVFKDGEFGLYDTCFGQFYKNQGTGKLSGAFDNETADTITLNGERYTRLDYIQNNGTNNYIEIPNLEITKTKGFEVEVEVEPTADVANDDRCCIFSSYSEVNMTTENNISLEIHRSSTTGSQNQARLYVDNQDCVNTSGVIANQKNKLKFSYNLGNGSCTVNNTTVTGSATTGSGSTWTGPFRIFVDNHEGGRFSTFNVPMKLYSMKIWSGGIKLAHYLPAINNNGIPGLINLVNGDFRPNASGDKFTYGEYEAKTGNIFTKGENSYRTLNYIETHPTNVEGASYRAGQYIRTGYTMDYSKGDSFEITTQATNAVHDGMFFGNFDGNFGVMYHTQSSGNGHRIAFFTSALGTLETGLSSDDTSKHTYKVTGTAMYVDGNLTGEIEKNDMKTSSEALIGTATNGTTWWYYSGRIYGCRIWRGTELKRDFIPVIKNETEYGLYDLVTENFYVNSGTGAFTGAGATSEFTAFYLGATDPELAPFSVTNTGKVKADAGEIGGFEITESALTSKNKFIELSSNESAGAAISIGQGYFTVSPQGNVVAKNLTATLAGQIGGFEICGNSLTNDYMTLSENSINLKGDNARLTFGKASFAAGASQSSIETEGPCWIQTKDQAAGIGLMTSTGSTECQVTLTLTGKTGIYGSAEATVTGTNLQYAVDISVTSTCYINGLLTGFTDKAEESKTVSVTISPSSPTVDTGTITNGYSSSMLVGFSKVVLDFQINGTSLGTLTLSSSASDNTTASITQTRANNTIQIVGNLQPKTPESYSLGTTGVRWGGVFVKSGGIDDSSDERLKNIDDTQTFKRYTKFFDKLRPISYTLKDNPAGNKLIGFGAQSVKQALLDSGLTGQDFDGYRHHGEDQYDSLCYTQFIPLNTYEIQQAKKRITDLETEILVLKETIDKLTAKLS